LSSTYPTARPPPNRLQHRHLGRARLPVQGRPVLPRPRDRQLHRCERIARSSDCTEHSWMSHHSIHISGLPRSVPLLSSRRLHAQQTWPSYRLLVSAAYWRSGERACTAGQPGLGKGACLCSFSAVCFMRHDAAMLPSSIPSPRSTGACSRTASCCCKPPSTRSTQRR